MKYNGIGILSLFLFLAVLIAAGSPRTAESASPSFNYAANQTVLEGESIVFDISASDSDGESLIFALVERPSGATLSDNGDNTATFSWTTAYTGPSSSEGSPFEVTFRASDGTNSDIMTVFVTVVNNNRAPVIEPVETVSFKAGELVSFGLNGSDPDNDQISWEILEAPAELQLSSSGRSGNLTWQTDFADSGNYPVEVVLSDTYEARDTVSFNLEITAATVYKMYIDSASGYPGEQVDINVNLMNLEPISGFNLLLNYDASALLLGALTELGTLSEEFEYFTYSLNHNNQVGDIKVTATYDIDGSGPTALAAGEGSILKFRFYITNDYTFAGFSIPVRFIFKDVFFFEDNTLVDPEGEMIEQEAIVYEDGYVLIKKADLSSIGDINLNGVPKEIADAIYYINYFINPGNYPLNPEQMANADVNLDGVSPSVADLVNLINGLVNLDFDSDSNKRRYFGDPATVDINSRSGQFDFEYDADVPVGGIAFTLTSPDGFYPGTKVLSDFETAGMTVKQAVEGNSMRVLIYSETGESLPEGQHCFATISTEQNFNIDKIELATADGAVLPAVLKDSGNLPEGFRLYQNYPNPFNPSTEIRFELPRQKEVTLQVFNLLGQEIRTLAEASYSAGRHSVIWDGKNDAGNPVSSGIYFYRLQAGEYLDRKKMVLLK